MNKLLVVALASSLTFSAFAAELSTQQQEALTAKLSPWVEKLKGGDFAAEMDIMPPKYFEYEANKTGIPVEDIKTMARESKQAIMSQTQVESYAYDLSKTQLEQSSSGRNYAFIPFSIKTKFGGNNTSEQTVSSEVITPAQKAYLEGVSLERKGHLLALEDEGEWYFFQWKDVRIRTVREIYPDMELVILNGPK